MAEHGHNRIDRSIGTGLTIKFVRLDSWAAQAGLSRVDVIKIDVEGAEKFVLEGGQDTIARFKAVLLCECEDTLSASFGYTPRDLIAQLGGLGYGTRWLDGVLTPTLLARPMERE
jgi:Methyltransferase FkbM domain